MMTSGGAFGCCVAALQCIATVHRCSASHEKLSATVRRLPNTGRQLLQGQRRPRGRSLVSEQCFLIWQHLLHSQRRDPFAATRAAQRQRERPDG